VFNAKFIKRCAAFAAAMLFIVVTALSFTACSKLTKEEDALYAAIKEVCPKSNNHSKAKYLAFAIEGWSFSEMPSEIISYLQEYCKQGNAAYMPESFDELVAKGYIAVTDDDYFNEFGENEKVFFGGEGKFFTFTLKEGDPVNSDKCVVKVTEYISDHDCSWFDLEMEHSSLGGWKCVKKSNVGHNQENNDYDPNGHTGPIK
jgi:hypothetical protein